MKSSVKDRIRKLLAQSSDSAVTPAEAEAFRAKALELMAREGLDEEELHRQPASTFVLDLDVPYSATFARGIYALSRSLHCECLYEPRTKQAFLFGLPRHLDRLTFLWPLLYQVSAAESVRMRGYGAGHTRRKRVSFVTSFFASVAERLAEAEYSAAREHNRAAAEGSGVELDLISDAATARDEMDEWLQERGMGVRTTSSRLRHDAEALAAGERAGLVVDIGQARFDERRRALPL